MGVSEEPLIALQDLNIVYISLTKGETSIKSSFNHSKQPFLAHIVWTCNDKTPLPIMSRPTLALPHLKGAKTPPIISQLQLLNIVFTPKQEKLRQNKLPQYQGSRSWSRRWTLAKASPTFILDSWITDKSVQRVLSRSACTTSKLWWFEINSFPPSLFLIHTLYGRELVTKFRDCRWLTLRLN